MTTLQFMPRRFFPLAASALVLLGACGDAKRDDTSRDVALTTDSVSRLPLGDTALLTAELPSPAAPTAQEPLVAGRAPLSAAQAPADVKAPATTAVAAARAPRPRRVATAPVTDATAPQSAPAAPARTSGEIAAGTTIGVSNGPKVCSSTLQVGDRVTVTNNAAVSGSNGVSIPSGARFGLVVTKSRTSGSQGAAAELEFDVRSVTFGGETYTVAGSVSTEAVVMERKGGDARKVAIGAAAGAVIGNIIGGGSRVQRTAVGAAAGGAAGAVTAAVTGDRLACLPEAAALTVRLGSALTVQN